MTRLADLDLHLVTTTTVTAHALAHAEHAGRLDGALLHFEAELAPGIMVSSDPLEADVITSWSNVLTLCSPAEVSPGQPLHLDYNWNATLGTPGLSVTVEEPGRHALPTD